MFSNHPSLIYTSIEYERYSFHQFFHNLTIYYKNFQSKLFAKPNEYLLYFTIIISIITLILILLIILESKIFSRFFRLIYSSNKNLFLKLKAQFFQSTIPPFFLTWTLNSSNYIQKRFLNEFIYSLNQEFFYQREQLNVEALQFANAKIHSVSQSSVETIVISAMLDVDHLILKVTDQHYSIEIPKLTGELQIFLINNIVQYSIDVKFERLQIDNAEIIDLNNILSSDKKQSILKLFQETISQTIVRCFYYLSDNQENIVNETKTELYIPPILPQLPAIDEQCETPVMPSITDNHQHVSPKNEPKRLLVRIVKAVKLHDVEQPFCTLELNYPKQTRQTSVAKNGVNPFWDERFLFECNEKSNQLRLQIFDRKKPNKKHNSVDIIYADVSIPFSYVTSTIYKQDVRITPQHPDSIIRIEFSTLCEEKILAETNKFQYEYQRSPSSEIITLPYDTDAAPKGRAYENNILNNTSSTLYSTTDTLSTLSPLTSQEDDIKLHKLRKSQSFMSSLRHLTFLRRKKAHKKSKETENGVIAPSNITAHIDSIPPNTSAEPFPSANTAGLKSVNRHRSIRDIFRSNSKKKRLNTSNFIIDQPELLPSPKQRPFFRRFKSKQKHSIDQSTNSLTSYDCTRSESVRNTPIRANVGYPVTMTKPLAQ